MRRTAHARARLAGLLLLLAPGCRQAEDSLSTLRRVPLPEPAVAGATLAVDSAGTVWVGWPGRLVALDTAGAALAEVSVGGDTVPRLLWRAGDRLALALPGRVAIAPAAGGSPGPSWRGETYRAALRDPRGRWVYAVTVGGGVVGLEPDSLRPRWGWPAAGAEPAGAAVSPLGDRVYVALDTATARGAAIQVRDAGTGRVLLDAPRDEAPTALVAGADGALFVADGGSVRRLEPRLAGLEEGWSRAVGIGDALALRTDPTGHRVAAFSPGERLVLLDARTGEVLGETREAPLDAAFGPEGRLYLLEERALRVVR
jgi:hypothetical protein